jgi:hypothetical protein
LEDSKLGGEGNIVKVPPKWYGETLVFVVWEERLLEREGLLEKKVCCREKGNKIFGKRVENFIKKFWFIKRQK